jgi:hypothetical protein
MRVLVTGASGTLAPFVIRALWERHEVVLLSRRPLPAERASLPWIQGDITVFDDCCALSRAWARCNTWPPSPGRWIIRSCGSRPHRSWMVMLLGLDIGA